MLERISSFCAPPCGPQGSFTLVRDRFKSFQKRGMIETHGPTIKQSLSRKRRVVEQGSQGAREREMHAEIQAMRAARQETKKAAAKEAMASSNLEL
ncbi:hypothetical protein CLOP_g8058 [Closterium sp. NIES-67]|nr:hypothetical protein CLOP_g8058 [Closterium sp. NIES-67]